MKKIVSVAVLAALVSGMADAAPRQLQRNDDGGYKVTYDYTDRSEVGRWYLGGHLDMNLLSWTNENSVDAAASDAHLLSDDSFTEVLLGGNIFVGHTFEYFWRAELEAGVISEFEEEDSGTSFKMTVPYLMANGYYDFANDFYVGMGLGMAMPKVRLQGVHFVGGDSSKRSVSPMLGFMGGWLYHLDYNLLLDLRYRLGMFWGPKIERQFRHNVDTGADSNFAIYDISADTGMVFDNSISVGIRYEF